MELNNQPIEKQQLTDGNSLGVIAIWPTIQGEGPYVGMPAVFIRLAGCDLQCPLCDTQYTRGRQQLSIDTILDQVEQLTDGRQRMSLVVLTGGEPLRQNIGPLARRLFEAGYQTQIETNGTLYLPFMTWGFVTVVCSPKTTAVSRPLIPYIKAWKYVVQEGQIDPDDGLPLSVLGRTCRAARPPARYPKEFVYVQPLDEQDEERNQKNLVAAVESCQRFGYRFCLQVQKIIGVQ